MFSRITPDEDQGPYMVPGAEPGLTVYKASTLPTILALSTQEAGVLKPREYAAMTLVNTLNVARKLLCKDLRLHQVLINQA